MTIAPAVAAFRLSAWPRMRTVIANLPAVTDAAVDWYGRIADDLLPAKRVIVVGYDGMSPQAAESPFTVMVATKAESAPIGTPLSRSSHEAYSASAPPST